MFAAVDAVCKEEKKQTAFFFFKTRITSTGKRRGRSGRGWMITCHQVSEGSRKESVVKEDLSFFLVITSFWMIF